MNKNPFSLLSKMKKENLEKASIIFLLGIFFLLVATPVSGFSEKKKTVKTSDNKMISNESDKVSESSQNNAYIDELENKLEQTISGMEGAGEVLVMITCKDTGEKILDKNQPYESESEKVKEDGKA